MIWQKFSGSILVSDVQIRMDADSEDEVGFLGWSKPFCPEIVIGDAFDRS